MKIQNELMINGVIYCAKCKISNKIYIGQTTQKLKYRINDHIYMANNGSKLPFHRAIRKYGIENFEITVVEECFSIDDLNQAECNWIKTANCISPNGYNCTTGGEHPVMNEETRKKISNATKGENNPFYGRTHTEESINKMKEELSRQFSGEGNPFYGKNHTEETKKKLSECFRGTKMHTNTREGIKKANLGNQYTKGRKLSLEHKEKLSKLKLDEVKYIKENPDNLSRKELAEKFNVTALIINNILSGRTWRDV